jgi:predicted nucleic acid-binding protein
VTAAPRELIFDTSCLAHFALADRLDVLHDLVLDHAGSTTHVVLEELRKGVDSYPLLADALQLEWLEIIRLDSLHELARFVEWTKRLGAGERNLGESSVCAAAELRRAIAIIDDGGARRVAQRYNLEVHGTLWLLASACRAGKLTEIAAGNLVDALRATGMRLPATGSEFGQWARSHGLL